MSFRELEEKPLPGSSCLTYFNCTCIVHYFQNLWSKYIPDLLVIIMCNDIGIAKVTLTEHRHFHTIVQV